MNRDEAMWMVVYVARGARQAQALQALLSAEGFLVRLRGEGGGEGQSERAFEVMVLRSEALEAQKFLLDSNL